METKHASDDEDFVTIGEAARIAQVSIDTMRRYADSGKIPVYRTPANHRRFKLVDVKALVKRQHAA